MVEYKIGLEIHMHLKTKEKLFCKCKIPRQDTSANTLICPRCTGQPGSKPMLPNKSALYSVLRLGLAMNCKVNQRTNFQRKHYSWPDMPTGFQRTVSGGNTKCSVEEGEFQGIGIEEIHLEENPAAWDPTTGEINYNRAGFPLAEIVTKPDFNSIEQLREWLEELILLGKYLGALDEDFGIKSDVNVSIKDSGYSRVEIKNVNSLTNIVRAAEVEIERQKDLVDKGERVAQETRRFNDAEDTTEFMRSKENVEQYMFTPEPDLPNVVITDSVVKELKNGLPEMPEVKREKYSKYNLKDGDIEVLVSNLYLTHLFEHAIDKKLNPREVGLFLRREIPRVLNYHSHGFKDLEDKGIKDEIVVLIDLLGKDEISYNTAQKVLEKLYEEKFDVAKYIEDNNLKQVQDNSLIEELVVKALKDAPKAVEDYKNGNEKAINFVVGIVMKETKGTAKPQVVNEILQEKIKEF